MPCTLHVSKPDTFTTQRLHVTCLAILLVATSSAWLRAGDWPMWRYDAGHTAASPESLPDVLRLKWGRAYEPRRQVWDDPLNNDLMQYDRHFEPIVKDGRVFLSFNDEDKVEAIEVATGETLWTFFTGGPVRFPPVAHSDSVFFVSDDGHLYSVNAESGEENWRFRGGPSNLKVIGNRRLISAWPARGAPVIKNDRVYFAASIWPFMGTFIYALDADTGEVEWVNDSTATQYIKQPHSAPSFAGVAPQGILTVVGKTLLVPGGRSVPAAFDLDSGAFRYFNLNAGGKGNGGSFVIGREDEYYVHTRERGVRRYDIATGTKDAFQVNEPVLGETQVYAASYSEDESKSPSLVAYDREKNTVWELEEVDGSGDIIRAGNRIYAAGGGTLTTIEASDDETSAKVVHRQKIPSNVVRLVAGAGHLIAVTLDGRIQVYGAPGTTDRSPTVAQVQREPFRDWGKSDLAEALITQSTPSSGMILIYGLADQQMLRALLDSTECDLVVVDEDISRVNRFRQELNASGVYGDRISVHHGSISTFGAPPYFAQLVVVSGRMQQAVLEDGELLKQAYRSVRPYGGCLALIGPDVEDHAVTVESAELENASLSSHGEFLLARRVGALTGAADWSHQYGDVANTVKSNDARVKLPLGLLWFGGSPNTDVLPRHGHGPPEQVVAGRLYIQGMNSISCRDVYTGQILWKREFEDLGTYDVYYDETYADTPLNPAYNQVHIPGANGRGTNYVATKDGLYLVIGPTCHVLDPQTGHTLREISLPSEWVERGDEWGYLGIYQDVLIGGAGFANYRKRENIEFEGESELSGNSKGYGSKSFDRSASLALVAFDRHSGEVLWKNKATHSFIHNGIVAGDGKVYCLDKLPKPIEDKLRRRGKVSPDTYRIVAYDIESGETSWEQTGEIFGTWLGYSEQYHLLLHAGAAASDRLKSEVGQGMAVYEGETGELRWRVANREYSGPCILHNDTILTNANSYQLSSGAFNLLDGSPKMINNPLTGKPEPWKISRAYGCNSIIASENLLTFRSGAAGYYDLTTHSGTGNLGGFKSGCTSNLVVANGVLNAPDYTRTCSCSYQNQTSLALVHMPEMEMWTVNHTARLTKPGQRIERLGINFGAPGDRIDDSGTLWLDYPVVGGDSAELTISVEGDVDYFHYSTHRHRGQGVPWIASSGVTGVESIRIPLVVGPSQNDLSARVAADEDDAEEDLKDNSVSTSSSDLELTIDKQEQLVGVRFPNVRLPRGTKVDRAYIQFECDEPTSGPTSLELRIEDTASAAPFEAASANLSSRATLADTIAWEPPAWKKSNERAEAQQTPDVTALLQAIVNRDDWKEGNAVAFLISGTGKRVAGAFKGNANHAAQLVIEANPVNDEEESRPKVLHTVRLHFAEPESIAAGERVFDVQLNGQLVDDSVDIIKAIGREHMTLVREYRDVGIADALTITFSASHGKPLINGVEIIRQQD